MKRRVNDEMTFSVLKEVSVMEKNEKKNTVNVKCSHCGTVFDVEWVKVISRGFCPACGVGVLKWLNVFDPEFKYYVEPDSPMAFARIVLFTV